MIIYRLFSVIEEPIWVGLGLIIIIFLISRVLMIGA